MNDWGTLSHDLENKDSIKLHIHQIEWEYIKTSKILELAEDLNLLIFCSHWLFIFKYVESIFVEMRSSIRQIIRESSESLTEIIPP